MTLPARQQFDTVLLPSLRRETLAARVAVILKRHVLTQSLRPGAALPSERRLADALNVSRTVLREALSQLVGEGVIERPAGRTLRVAQFDADRLVADLAAVTAQETEIQDLLELRVIIEIGAIEAIVRRADDADLREIERWVVEGERRVSAGLPGVLADARFHAALLRTLGNGSVNALLPLIEEHLRHNLSFDAHTLHPGAPDAFRVVTDHRRIYEAVKSRDVERARLLMLAHLNMYLNDRTMAHIAHEEPADPASPIVAMAAPRD